MKVIGIVGWSGSGKTTLITTLLPLLRARGQSVSTVKHTHHGFDMDRPGKDTYRHREAGAHEVLVSSGKRWALLHEVEGDEPPLPELLARLSPVDLVLASRATRSPSWRCTAPPSANRRSGRNIHRNPRQPEPPAWSRWRRTPRSPSATGRYWR